MLERCETLTVSLPGVANWVEGVFVDHCGVVARLHCGVSINLGRTNKKREIAAINNLEIPFDTTSRSGSLDSDELGLVIGPGLGLVELHETSWQAHEQSYHD